MTSSSRLPGLFVGAFAADTLPVDEQIWTFSRDGKQLEIQRTATDEGYLLGLEGDGPPRTYFFEQLSRLEAFQADLEKFLLGTGWTFAGFKPERRIGHERRHFSRLLTDRRRWWTDGAAPIPRDDDEGEGRRNRRRSR